MDPGSPGGGEVIRTEPIIRVGVLEGYRDVRGQFQGSPSCAGTSLPPGDFNVTVRDNTLIMNNGRGEVLARGTEIRCSFSPGNSFVLHDVTIGVHFHWERKEDQRFEGNLLLVARTDGTITAINEIPVEAYLMSVISSEMSAEAPEELLKAHAITSRSWLVAMLERSKKTTPATPTGWTRDDEIIRWYTREDHDIYDVCADDHCQRYQGVTKIISPAVKKVVDETRGMFLVYAGEICDARFYKACGGITDEFRSSWEEIDVPYLKPVSDAAVSYPAIGSESAAEEWILSRPEAYCNTSDPRILRQILPSFDQETTDFFRWQVAYEREMLEQLILRKSGIDFGTLMALEPVQRGPSGRIIRLRVSGTNRTIIVGKDLEIRRWLSPSHLYSSAFVVRTERGGDGVPLRFTLHGAGWGHGVGLCQIGAAIMAVKGMKADVIVRHYFPGASLLKVY